MDAHKRQAKRFLGEETGATAIEYAVMMAMILLAAVGSIATLGPTVASKLVIPGW